jgi:aldehyde dehydrogenase (NAD+)
MREYLKFYINGEWVNPVEMKLLAVENPATEWYRGQNRARLGR